MKNRDSRKFLMDLVDLKSIQDPELIASISDIRELFTHDIEKVRLRTGK